jgi:hypothetical protein
LIEIQENRTGGGNNMIRFVTVVGRCMVDNAMQCTEAYPGLSIEHFSNSSNLPCFIYTGPSSRIELDIDGRRLSMTSNSIMKIGGGKREIKGVELFGRWVERYLGPLWAAIGGGRVPERLSGNTAGGVRG